MINKTILIVILFLAVSHLKAQKIDEKRILVNGVEVSAEWPPHYPGKIGRKSLPVPYLEVPQKIIPVNVGRQLFVDNFLIDSTNLTPVYHTPVFIDKNPVLSPDRAWEYNSSGLFGAPFSDGIWYDETGMAGAKLGHA